MSKILYDPKNHEYRRRQPSKASRSPCPALNSLANHGYISREGTDLTFTEVLNAIVFVYNFSYPLALLLTLGGFMTSAKISLRHVPPKPQKNSSPTEPSWTRTFKNLFKVLLTAPSSFIPHITLDLASLSHRGHFKIAHDASFVHPNDTPSTTPAPALVMNLVSFASNARDVQGQLRGGIGLSDIARFHADRIQATSKQLGTVHTQIAQGECAFTYLALRGQQSLGHRQDSHEAQEESCDHRDRLDGVVPTSRLEQWFGEERLPDGWWDVRGIRPANAIGILQARSIAGLIGQLAASVRRDAGDDPQPGSSKNT